MVFNHDWWFHGGFQQHKDEARRACTRNRFPRFGQNGAALEADAQRFCDELETRSVLYLRDGLSLEIKRLVESRMTTYLSFECVPVEEAYKVGAFIVAVPFEEICRVETFAVHPSEKPDDLPAIKGFSGVRAATVVRGSEDRPARPEAWEPSADESEVEE